MKTLIPLLVATSVAAIIAGFFAILPDLFQPAFGLWVVVMMIILTRFEYTNRSDLGHH